MKTEKAFFIGDNFLLRSNQAVRFYHEHAARMPIIDYHNHLSPKDIAEDRKFKNITEAWLEGDHYKWRAMRSNGVPERYCTGDATPEEKFMKWAETVPFTMRNPLYHWTHLELRNYFGVNELLDKSSAQRIYEHCSNQLNQDSHSVRSLLKMQKVEVLCTTDDPTDTLEYHKTFAAQNAGFKMFPTFRPDKSFAAHDPIVYREYLQKLSAAAGVTINNFDDLLSALRKRIDFFESLGCRASDHGLESLFFHPDGEKNAPALFIRLLAGDSLDAVETIMFKSAVLTNLCKMYHSRGWVQQFHLGAQRNNSSRMMRELGPDTGFDSIGEYPQGLFMAKFFDNLDSTNQLARTIIYNLNPADNELFATMTGNFNDGSVPGKMQFGSGWWFLDQKDGMEKQMNALSNMGLISRFVGMVTDSRSFLSFPRHEYFRRILCNLFGTDVENGELPDSDNIPKIIERICYQNAREYFEFR
ncbi:glucuronate isomerase [Chryseolinea sp. T2]|uniref:glucuronate isomerase n=1 Tax=Chryseolinea sp. T2 TaxID=3129255 RepID=UPI0030776995